MVFNGLLWEERPSFYTRSDLSFRLHYYVRASSMFWSRPLYQTVDLNKPIPSVGSLCGTRWKITHMLSLLNREKFVGDENEVIRSRANILAENIFWSGAILIALVTNSDPQHFKTYRLLWLDCCWCTLFGRRLVSPRTETMLVWSPANVELCSQRQRGILADVFPALGKRPLDLQRTCTYNRVREQKRI